MVLLAPSPQYQIFFLDSSYVLASSSSNVACGPAAGASPGSSLETQTLRPYLKPTQAEPSF